MRLQWTDTDGRILTGQPDDVMRRAYLAQQHHTIKPCGMFIPKDHLTTESSMPLELTADNISCMTTTCRNAHGNHYGFGYDEANDLHYCRECGNHAGAPYVSGALVEEMPFVAPPVPVPTPTVDDWEARLESYDGTWTKFDDEWCARIPVDDGVDVMPGATVILRRKNGSTTEVVAGETLRRFRNTDGSWFPYVAIVRIVKED